MAVRWGTGWGGWRDIANAQKDKFGVSDQVVAAAEEKVPPELAGEELELRDSMVKGGLALIEGLPPLDEEKLRRFKDRITDTMTELILASRKPRDNK